MQVARLLEADSLRELHRHGRTLAECTDEDELLGLAQRVQGAPGLERLGDRGIGHMQGLGHRALPFQLARLANVDDRRVASVDGSRKLAMVTAQPLRATSPCDRPIRLLAGTATSIIFGLGRRRLFMSST
jgi:hypothetical protein